MKNLWRRKIGSELCLLPFHYQISVVPQKTLCKEMEPDIEIGSIGILSRDTTQTTSMS
ncbi:hypothetical protein KPLM21_380009 [Klebsiella pneumoniae]|nr:hypothetical protein KPLM21_380009 [Klebsiella pneumoniae]